MKFSQFGNDLYTGKRSIPVISRRRIYYLASLIVIAIAVGGLLINKLNLGLEFTGGSEFRVSTEQLPDDYERAALDAISGTEGTEGARVSQVGTSTVRVQTERLAESNAAEVRGELATAFGVGQERVSATFIGPSWGQSVTNQALRALAIFLVLVGGVLAIYFRNWKMSLAALIAIVHDLVITVGIYSFSGFEVSPATMIGFLTVLSYSIYDTVVVFDKVRENTSEAFDTGRMNFADASNLAVNQTIVRSINTTVIGVLPIVAVLVIGVLFVGPGTLVDLSLVLFVGLVVGAYSSIFLATPLMVDLRRKDDAVAQLDRRAAGVQARQEKDEQAREARRTKDEQARGMPAAPARADGDEEPALVGARSADEGESTLTGRRVHKYAQTGPRGQPKKRPRSKR